MKFVTKKREKMEISYEIIAHNFNRHVNGQSKTFCQLKREIVDELNFDYQSTFITVVRNRHKINIKDGKNDNDKIEDGDKIIFNIRGDGGNGRNGENRNTWNEKISIGEGLEKISEEIRKIRGDGDENTFYDENVNIYNLQTEILEKEKIEEIWNMFQENTNPICIVTTDDKTPQSKHKQNIMNIWDFFRNRNANRVLSYGKYQKDAHSGISCKIVLSDNFKKLYYGNFLDGDFNGIGKIIVAKGSEPLEIIRAEFEHGVMIDGLSLYFAPDFYAELKIRNGTINYGTIVFKNGIIYKGGMNGKEIYGFGVCIYPDGSTYHGNWINGKKFGTGVFKHSDGTEILKSNWGQ